jgi:hypothetical protein
VRLGEIGRNWERLGKIVKDLETRLCEIRKDWERFREIGRDYPDEDDDQDD